MTVVPSARQTASESWGLITRLFFLEGKPRFPAIAAELELSPAQANVLRQLDEPRPMSELAVTMACDASNVTGIVDRLEERGLAERRPAQNDRRVKLIAATAAGQKLRKELMHRIAIPPEPLTRLSEADQRTLRDILRKAFAQ